MNSPTHILIHHSLTQDSKTLSWDAIRNYHKETNGWSDIGYHLGLERIGKSAAILFGRPFTADGAHCRGYNQRSIGICCVGNFNLHEPSPELLEQLVNICFVLCITFSIPAENILGHREADTNRTCPGSKFDLTALRQEVQNRIIDHKLETYR